MLGGTNIFPEIINWSLEILGLNYFLYSIEREEQGGKGKKSEAIECECVIASQRERERETENISGG